MKSLEQEGPENLTIMFLKYPPVVQLSSLQRLLFSDTIYSWTYFDNPNIIQYISFDNGDLITLTFEEFHRKTGYIHFCQFEIFAIEAAEI